MQIKRCARAVAALAFEGVDPAKLAALRVDVIQRFALQTALACLDAGVPLRAALPSLASESSAVVVATRAFDDELRVAGQS